MSYQEQSDRYRDGMQRGRYEACISEQAQLTFAADADLANQALAYSVIKSVPLAVDSLIRSITTGPNSASLEDDASLLSAVQAAWPVTAQAWSEA